LTNWENIYEALSALPPWVFVVVGITFFLFIILPLVLNILERYTNGNPTVT